MLHFWFLTLKRQLVVTKNDFYKIRVDTTQYRLRINLQNTNFKLSTQVDVVLRRRRQPEKGWIFAIKEKCKNYNDITVFILFFIYNELRYFYLLFYLFYFTLFSSFSPLKRQHLNNIVKLKSLCFVVILQFQKRDRNKRVCACVWSRIKIEIKKERKEKTKQTRKQKRNKLLRWRVWASKIERVVMCLLLFGRCWIIRGTY